MIQGVVQVVDLERLVGLWSDDLVYSGAMEFEVVFFGADGRGCFAWQNTYSTQGCVFTWGLDGDRLTTRTSRTFSNEPGQSEELTSGDGSSFDLDAALVSLAIRQAGATHRGDPQLGLAQIGAGCSSMTLPP